MAAGVEKWKKYEKSLLLIFEEDNYDCIMATIKLPFINSHSTDGAKWIEVKNSADFEANFQ